MSNAIKQRQLKNDDKLTPKTDFITLSQDGVNYHYGLYNQFNGTERLDRPYSSAYGTPISVGKGQVLAFGASGGDINNYRLILKNKKTGATVNQLTLDKYSTRFPEDPSKIDGAAVYYNEYKTVEFLGKINGKRAVVFTGFGFSTQNPNKYHRVVWNIDDWEVIKIFELKFGDTIDYDYVYDGNNTIYCTRSGNNILEANTISTGNSFALKDDSDNFVKALSIYGMYDGNIVFEDINNVISFYNISTGVIEQETFSRTGKCAVNYGTIVYSSNTTGETNAWYVRDDLTGSGTGLQTTYSSMRGQPVLILDRDEIDGDDIIRIIGYDTISQKFVRVTLTVNESTRFIQDLNIPWPSNGRVKEATRHSCNTYGIGRFFNYGLQKQWDSMTEAKDGKM